MISSSKSLVSVSERIAKARQSATSNVQGVIESQKVIIEIYGKSSPSVAGVYSAYTDYDSE